MGKTDPTVAGGGGVLLRHRAGGFEPVVCGSDGASTTGTGTVEIVSADERSEGDAAVTVAPWRLVGEAIVAWVPTPAFARSLLPVGVRPLPGRSALVGVWYSSSPVGPYVELSLALPARVGLRPGLSVVFQILSVPAARTAYRSNWGLPAVVGPLSWSGSDDGGSARVLRCESPFLELRGVPVGPAFPAVMPVRSLQRRADGPVVVPRRVMALVRWGRASVSVDRPGADGGGDDGSEGSDGSAGSDGGAASRGAAAPGHSETSDLFAAVAGEHPGLVLAGARFLARPARHPAGLWSSLRAPLAAPEPAMAGGATGPGRGHYSRHPHRALSSVG